MRAASAVQHEEALFASVCATAMTAATAASVTYDNRMRPIMNFATWRHAASLYQVDKPYLDAIDFGPLLAEPGALPYVPDGEAQPRYPWTWRRATLKAAAAAGASAGGGGSGGAVAAAAPDAADDSHLDANINTTLREQWIEFKVRASAAAVGDARTVTSADRKCPARYWIRTRPFWPDLSEVVLLWLMTPISTACVERGFSFMTMMDANTRRRRMKVPGFRADFMAHLHRDWLRSALLAASK